MSTNNGTRAKAKFWGLCFGLGIFIGITTFFQKNAIAQVVPDNTLPTNSRVTNQGNTNLIEGGTQAGGNLFHSFQQFSILNNNTAFFNNSVDIRNIISRVTGGSISNIDGLIRANGTANLFLINPSGIVFGPNASLNVGGSFFASTANSIQFGNVGFFSASNPQAPSPLLTINPSALAFNQFPFAPIRSNSVAPAGVNPIGENITGLRVADGKSLALVGGNVNIEGGGIRAYGGRVELAGLTAPGEIGLNFTGDILSLNVPSNVARGDVSLSNGAIVDTQASGGGSVAINALNFNLTGGSFIVAGIERGLGTPDAIVGDIDINATGKSTLSDRSFIANFINLGSRGKGGNINLTTSELFLSNLAQIVASTFGQEKAGSIIINADRGVTLDASVVFSSVNQTAAGNSGNISIKSSELSLINGARISSSVSGQGDAGNIFINVRDNVSVARSLILSNIGTPQRQPGVGVGNIGSISIEAGTVSVTDGGQLQAGIFSGGRAPKSGVVSIRARDSVSFSGENSGIFNDVEQRAIGNGSDILISAPSISINGNGAGLIASNAGEGNAANITANADSLSLSNGAIITSSASGQGDAGNIFINVHDNVSVARSLISSNIGTPQRQPGVGVGNIGSILIEAGTVSVTDGGQLQAGIFSGGRALKSGVVSIRAKDSVSFFGQNSGIFNNVEQQAVGNGSDILISAPSVLINGNGAGFTTDNTGVGNAGNIAITSPKVRFQNQASLLSQSTSGNGGNITLQVADILLILRESLISTSAGIEGRGGNGGNITINAPNGFLVALPNENSDITANAFTGAGGRVKINATGIFGIEPRSRNDLVTRLGTNDPTQLDPQRLQSNDITAISQNNPSLEGQVSIITPDVDASQGVSEFPVNPINISTLTDSSCAAFGPNSPNQFIITGRGGLPPTPNDPLTPDALWTDTRILNIPSENLKPQKKQQSRKKTTTPASEMIPATGWVFNDKGEVMLVASNSNSLPYGFASIPCGR